MTTSLPVAATAPVRPLSSTRRFFPGWIMLLFAGAAQYLSAPGQSYSVAAFKDPMRASLELTETSFSLAYACATVLSACLLPWVGRLVDRFGARLMLPLIAIGLGSFCWYMSLVKTLPGLYVAFAGVRSLGQGAMYLISAWIVGEWFEKRRGMATALVGLGGGLSVMTVPLINRWLITHYSWSIAWTALAITVWVVLILPTLLFLRDRPEDLGLQPDGEPHPDENDESEALQSTLQPPVHIPPEESWTVSEVMRDATFWKLTSASATSALVGTGLVFHQVALLGAHGLDPEWALGMLTIQAAFATLMTFPAGYLTDRIASRYILCGSMFALAAANLLVIAMPFPWLAFPYAMLLGLHGSITRSTAQVVWINYYGRAHQGAVRGVAWSAMILAAAVGPLPLAMSIDRFGSYQPALWALLALPTATAVAVFTAHPPKHPRTGDPISPETASPAS